MDMIGQHLDVLDADWITFGNVNLEQWLLLSARMTRKFVKRSKFFCFLVITEPLSVSPVHYFEQLCEKLVIKASSSEHPGLALLRTYFMVDKYWWQALPLLSC